MKAEVAEGYNVAPVPLNSQEGALGYTTYGYKACAQVALLTRAELLVLPPVFENTEYTLPSPVRSPIIKLAVADLGVNADAPQLSVYQVDATRDAVENAWLLSLYSVYSVAVPPQNILLNSVAYPVLDPDVPRTL